MLDRRATLTLGAATLGTAVAFERGSALAQAPQAPQAAPTPGQPPAQPTASPAPPYRPHTVRTPDGLSIQAYEYGNPNGPAILLIHGYAQSALSWDRQTRDPDLAREFRMVAYDVRGHGMSDKPTGDQYYKPSKPWSDEVRAVIEQTGLVRPVLVGWSYGGRIMGDYLTEHGHGAIGGMDWVCATSSGASALANRRNRGFSGPAAMGSADPATAIRSTIAFLRECFETQPATADFETMLAFNMMVPRHVRVSMQGRPADYEARLRALDIPVLVTHGELDKLVDIRMGRYTAETVPNAKLSVYENVGHAPFWEDTPRFNRELAELTRAAAQRR